MAAPGKIRFILPRFLPEGGGVVIVALENPVPAISARPRVGPVDVGPLMRNRPLVAPVSVSSFCGMCFSVAYWDRRPPHVMGLLQHLLDHVLERRHTCGESLAS